MHMINGLSVEGGDLQDYHTILSLDAFSTVVPKRAIRCRAGATESVRYDQLVQGLGL